MTGVAIAHNPGKSRYEATVDGEAAGFAEYQLTDEIIVFTHTEVDRRFEGRGVGSALARFALDDVRADGVRQVLPVCPFIKGWIARHPDYHHLMYGAPRTTAVD
ncbi:N-acetyltransferase [Nocardioides sp. IC4_145]|uniref:GNAT family N-acetyltransferase n=1 Tax=Nocardioides sp. IC4_145 TaxID=2714037 RepID=UPI00140A3580|nr:GNAT family N-acetyltransferase [Nocardioides sp. IC4_145]NHC22879.1 N-acetyltransferase [Nocardioides sp. IC4_145]